jgi:hypothetical protein
MNYLKTMFTIIIATCLITLNGFSQYEDFNTVKATIDFKDKIREWDGFGVNYVQTAHTKDYTEFPQEYGGFSLLSEEEQNEIIEMIFGEDGLKVNLLKMFLDPLHQKEPGGEYDHKTTTQYMVSFAKKANETLKKRNDKMQIMTTLYGPPAYMTKQKELRGRDLDPAHKKDLALYMIDWAKYLQQENLPIKYISLHNEGEDWRRWAVDGTYANFEHGHDYNLYWRPEEVADFLAFMPEVMEEEGLEGVSVTNGEPSRWYQFYFSGYAKDIYENEKALNNIGLLTSHNFYRSVPPGHRWFCGTSNLGTDLIRTKRPDLHAWVTSASWGDMDVDFVWQIYMNLYMAKANGYIPWAVIQRPPHWIGGDPNPGTAFVVREDGSYEVLPGYYWYKQMSRAGQAGMAVSYAECMDSEVQLVAFGKDDTDNPDAFAVINTGLSFIWRSDAVNVSLGNEYIYFSTKDPIATYERHEDVTRHIGTTDNGYVVEMAIPWESINQKPAPGIEIDLQVGAREGAYSLAGELGWTKNGGKLILADESEINNTTAKIKSIETPIIIDGVVENTWNEINAASMDVDLHSNNKDWFKGTWKAAYDDKNIYFLIHINDETNLMSHKSVELQLNGTDHNAFDAYRTTEDGELYEFIGTFEVKDDKIMYETPSKSITTFFGK